MKQGLILALALAGIAQAQAPTVSVAPDNPVPGSLVRFTLSDATGRSDAIVSARGTVSGEPMRFLRAESGSFHAIGPIPVEASDNVNAQVVVQRASGATDTVNVAIAVPHTEVPKTQSTLAVDQRFTRPLDAATRARIDRENARARAVGRRSHDTPPLWTEPFARPRDTRVTSEFGTGRTFNGKVASRHLGVDYQGAPGEPVRAANRGVVALVDTFFLAGRLVYIDHGGGVVTGYFHLSKPMVAKGDTVSAGQVIGQVGSTGRVTGPHLHWTARYGAQTFNPNELLGLETQTYSGSLSSRP